MLQESSLKTKRMKIRQNMITDLAASDWTREKLAEEVLIARYHSKKNRLESHWLDQVVSVLRDEGEEGRGQDFLYKEYKDDIRTLKHLYLEPKES
jgi:uncharacterized protein YicC (UPF0701 family)